MPNIRVAVRVRPLNRRELAVNSHVCIIVQDGTQVRFCVAIVAHFWRSLAGLPVPPRRADARHPPPQPFRVKGFDLTLRPRAA